jgi:hypothetical protein
MKDHGSFVRDASVRIYPSTFTTYRPPGFLAIAVHIAMTYTDRQNSSRSEKITLSLNAAKPQPSPEISLSSQSTDSPNSTPPSFSAIS